MNDVTLVRVTMTSIACPAQWDAWDEAGNYYYLRYRHGHGSIRQYRTADWTRSDEDELIRDVASFDHGHPLDGSITLEDFARLAGITLAPGIACTGLGDWLRDEMVTRHGWTFLLTGPEEEGAS
jgi:hypothetical protein